MTVFADALDTLFETLGVEATYIPSGGEPVSILIIPKQPDEVTEFYESRIQSETTIFEFRVSDIPQLQRGDTINYQDTVYSIQGEPKRNDPDRLIWTVEAIPV